MFRSQSPQDQWPKVVSARQSLSSFALPSSMANILALAGRSNPNIRYWPVCEISRTCQKRLVIGVLQTRFSYLEFLRILTRSGHRRRWPPDVSANVRLALDGRPAA